MKKFATLALFLGVILVGIAPAFATKPNDDGFHKVVICHNVGHNPHAVSIDIAAVAGGQDTAHGLLVLDANLNFVSFTPHDSEGHDQDFFLHLGAEVKPDDDEACQPEVTTTTQAPVTTTTQAPVTTTTQAPVTTTTQAPVTTTTQAPVTTTTVPVVTTTTEPEVKVVVVSHPDPAPAAPGTDVLGVGFVQPAPASELPRTGSASSALAGIGVLVGLTGLGLLLFSAALKRVRN